MRSISFSIACFTCLLQIFIDTGSAQVMSRALYGENCTKEIRCESRNFLTCSNGQCTCLMPDTMVFEEKMGHCVTLAGERCQYNSVEGETTWMEEVPCISNAFCQSGICECNSSHYEISNGTCLPKRDHGSECITNEMCNDKKHLVCGNEQTCVCQPNRYFKDDVCILFAGNACLEDDKCTDGSICTVEPTNPIPSCRCEKQYYQAENGKCEWKSSLGGDCTADNQCFNYTFISFPPESSRHEIPSFLVCMNGKCQCDDSISTIETSGVLPFCRKYWGEACNQFECMFGSDCTTGTCQCVSNYYVEMANKTCKLQRSHGEFCDKDEHCRKSLRCDIATQTCACELGNAFDPVSKSCVVGAGYRCRDNRRSPPAKTCISNAQCVEHGYYDYKCDCSQSTAKAVISDGYCYIKENGTCDSDRLGPITTKTCLPGLVCRDASCVCLYKEHQVFNQITGKCLSYARGPCNDTTDCLDENAECSTENGISQCLCKRGFTQVGRACDRAYGEKCVQGDFNPGCDRFGPLECSVREICECSDFKVYDRATLRCRGLVGAKCKSSWNSGTKEIKEFCVEGAFCQQFRGFQETDGLCTCQPGWKTETNRTCTRIALPITTKGTVDNLFDLPTSFDLL